MDNIDGSLVIAQTGENFIHSNDEPKLIRKTFTKIATSYVFEENMNHSHLIILSNKIIPDVKKLVWNKVHRNCFQKDQSYDDIVIQSANKIFENFVEVKHDYNMIYCMKYNAKFEIDAELPEFYDEDFNNSQFNNKIENIISLYSMNCIQNSQLVRDIGLLSITISNSEIDYKEIKKDIKIFNTFKENHPNVNLDTLIKEISDDIKNLKNLKNQKHEYDNKIEEIEKKEKDQKARNNGWGWGWGFGYSKSQYKSMSEKLEDRIIKAKTNKQLICTQNNINKNELKSIISIKYPINMLESDMKIGKTHLQIKVKSNEVNLINSMRRYFKINTVPLCSIIVSHHIRSCFSKNEFISKIESICERFGGVVKNISDYQKYEKNPINQGFILITLYTCQFAIPFAGEVKIAFCDHDFSLLRIPSNIVYPILENHPAIIEAIDDWIEFHGLIFHKKYNKYYGSLNEIEKAQKLFNKLKIPYKKFSIPKKTNLSKIEIAINRINASSFKNCDELQWILDKSSGFIYVNCDEDLMLKVRNNISNEEEFIYDYLLLCEEEAMISKYPMPLYQQNGSVRVSNFCLTCAYDLFANEVERFFDQKSDQPKMNLLLENVMPVKTIEMLPDLTNDSFWPEIPLGQMLFCLTSEPSLNSVVKTWFTAIVVYALHSSPLIQYCPDHPAILMQNNNKIVKCSQPGCKMYYCLDCKKWHKPAECKQKIKVPAGFRICPSCKRPVEKVSACNHIKCECGKHFCFYCGWGPTNTEQQVYNHLNSEHNGHGNNPPDYKKYYLHQNVSDNELKNFYQSYPQLVPSKDFYIYFDS